jgi:hypothetical protein
MSGHSTFYRKLGYLTGLAVLLWVMSLLASPAAVTPAGVVSPGGKLSQLRAEYRLGQGNFGDIDPASETIKLATLGLRGIATNLLWQKALDYKKKEDWTNLTATLDQLAKLQPNFISFWKFQSWNLSYNVSAEFDDYHDRYYYVRRGIEFLEKGERYNRNNPQLLYELGWFIGHKIGRADEHVQYRRLFKADNDFHPPERTMDERDNWLVGKEKYLEAVHAVDVLGNSLGKKNPRNFYSKPAMSQMSYAEAIEDEGFFDKARGAWAKAAEDWEAFGQREIEHSTGKKLHLGDEPRLQKELDRLRQRMEEFSPGAREAVEAAKRAKLAPEELRVLNMPFNRLSEQEQHLAYHAREKLRFATRDLAEYIAKKDPALAREAYALARELDEAEQLLRLTIHYKTDSNYDYWATRAEFEQTKDALDARRLMYQAKREYRENADLLTAKRLYDEGFQKWRTAIDRYPSLMEFDFTTGDDLMDFIKEYRKVLDQLDEKISDDFPLWTVIENFDNEAEFADDVREHKQKQLEETATDQKQDSTLNEDQDSATDQSQ